VADSRRRVFCGAIVLAALSWSPSFRAHEHNACVEVNNTSNNRLGVFELLGATGQLKWVQEVTTGGMGENGGYISLPQIASTRPQAGKACVFASNARSHNVTAFEVTIEHEAGTPCPCSNKAAGGPVSIGLGAQFGPLGGGVAVTPDGKALYTANPGSSDISTFTVRAACAITLVPPRVPAPLSPADIQVKPDGRCLAVSSPRADRVAMYRIGPSHQLTAVGQFAVPGPGRASGIEFTSQHERAGLYVSKAAPETAVIVRFDVDDACRLGTSPRITTRATGRTSSVAKLDPENRCLFVPNHASGFLSVNHPPSTLSAFSVDPVTGALTHVTTVEDVAFYPAGLGFGRTYSGERFLYYTSFTREIFRRRITGCVPGPVIQPGVPTSNDPSLPATGPLRTLTIIQ
jgi:hypothetical protein